MAAITEVRSVLLWFIEISSLLGCMNGGSVASEAAVS
jgi:hypothetical protein